jgi:hypothetical protein
MQVASLAAESCLCRNSGSLFYRLLGMKKTRFFQLPPRVYCLGEMETPIVDFIDFEASRLPAGQYHPFLVRKVAYIYLAQLLPSSVLLSFFFREFSLRLSFLSASTKSFALHTLVFIFDFSNSSSYTFPQKDLSIFSKCISKLDSSRPHWLHLCQSPLPNVVQELSPRASALLIPCRLSVRHTRLQLPPRSQSLLLHQPPWFLQLPLSHRSLLPTGQLVFPRLVLA